MAEKIKRLPLRPSQELPDLYNKSSIIRRGHCIGYIPFQPNSRILTCLCFESGGIGLSTYPSLEIAYSLKDIHPVRFLIPTYEYRTYKLLKNEDIERNGREAEKLLHNKGFEVIDVSEEPYKSRRLGMAMKLLPYMEHENPLNAYPLGEKYLQLALGVLEIADIFLCIEDHGNTVVVSDEGCAGPVITTKKIAKYLGFESKSVGALAYCEAVSLDSSSTMYIASESKKLHLMDDDPNPKIKHSTTAGGGTMEEHKLNGGKPYMCPVQIVHSMIGSSDKKPHNCAQHCMAGRLDCGTHKTRVIQEYENFMERLRQ